MATRQRTASMAAVCILVLTPLLGSQANAAPMFARQYNVSCNVCHSAFPALNAFGEQFAASNFRLPNWRDTTLKTGDDQLALPDSVPAAFRAQAFAQARDGEAVDEVTGERTEADSDFQSPYLIKLLSSAPLSDNITYYFYGIFAEKGSNGEVIIEDAWFSYDDLFGSGTSMMLGQFQVSDLMFPRETRLTFQDFMAYRMAGITYDRGVLFERGFGPVDVGLGLVNGNGIEENVTINSPGYRRSDHLFDNDTDKAVFARFSTSWSGVDGGLFLYAGEQKNSAGPAGIDSGERDTDKEIVGIDLSGRIRGNWRWFGQALWNRWDDFIDVGQQEDWYGGFAGVDYTPPGRWAYSALYNYADANDLDGTDTVFEGIDINSITLSASYYFMRNVKGVMEVNFDLLDEESQTGDFYTGHLTREHYVLVGFDAAF
ncbi:MAG: hypothetical protein U5Q16_17290 [Gammaproteobacteria bacterium]|nr:hypothetical protein [Gammaproteobacteria bacterium]